eukprot:gb/GFBE01013316.1/.p1 GENE.gb/GFBE01013316.1/~~gb/GFBE01013316.1/.p1  ORF type:complete len:358 (+),score=60.21 gb/GFBE01013316.1/:1-1074(+)
MAPIEDLQSRDLAWISDFVMQQMVIMMRPMMDHLHQTDSAVDYAQRQAQRLSMDVTELRADLERTNKYLAILRQGLGVQNEGKCMLQRSLDGNTRTVKRLDEQMESLLSVMRGVEDSFSQLSSDVRTTNSRHEELSTKLNDNNLALGDLQVKVERISTDAHVASGLEADRLEVWHRELRELRRGQIGLAPKLEEKALRAPPSSQSVRAGTESWPQKRSFATVDVSGSSGNTPGSYSAASNFGDGASSFSGVPGLPGSQQSKRISRVGSSSSRAQDQLSFGVSGRSSSRVWSPDKGVEVADESMLSAASEEAHESSRLPLLAARPGVTRPAERTAGNDGPRLRFTATMANPPSTGNPK